MTSFIQRVRACLRSRKAAAAFQLCCLRSCQSVVVFAVALTRLRPPTGGTIYACRLYFGHSLFDIMPFSGKLLGVGMHARTYMSPVLSAPSRALGAMRCFHCARPRAKTADHDSDSASRSRSASRLLLRCCGLRVLSFVSREARGGLAAVRPSAGSARPPKARRSRAPTLARSLTQCAAQRRRERATLASRHRGPTRLSCPATLCCITFVRCSRRESSAA
jgi:hypothetical protein